MLEHWNGDRRNSRKMFEELQQLGYRGSYPTLARYLRRLRAVDTVVVAGGVKGVLSLLNSGGVIFLISLRSVATVAAGWGRVGEHCEVEVDDGFERFGCRAVAQAFRQCVEPGGILGL